MTNALKVLAIAGLLVVAGFFAVVAYAQTTPPTTNTSFQRGGMMGGYTGSQVGGSHMGRGMMGGMMGGSYQMPDWDDMSSMMNSFVNGTSQNMANFCRNFMGQFGSNQTVP